MGAFDSDPRPLLGSGRPLPQPLLSRVLGAGGQTCSALSTFKHVLKEALAGVRGAAGAQTEKRTLASTRRLMGTKRG